MRPLTPTIHIIKSTMVVSLTVNNAEITSQETVKMQTVYLKTLLAHESASGLRRHRFLQKKNKTVIPQASSDNLGSCREFGWPTSGLAGEVCVLGVVSALFSRSVILVSFADAGLDLLQGGNGKCNPV